MNELLDKRLFSRRPRGNRTDARNVRLERVAEDRERRQQEAEDQERRQQEPEAQPEPQRTRNFRQGNHYDPVQVVFPSDDDANVYDQGSRAQKAVAGRGSWNRVDRDLIRRLNEGGYSWIDYVKAVRQQARDARKRQGEGKAVIEAPSYREFVKTEAEPETGGEAEPTPDFETRAREIITGDEDARAKNRAIKALASKADISEKEAQERVESVLVDIGREIAASTEMSQREKFDALIDLYNRQPRFRKRTSTSIRNQAYSTPLPLAFAVSMMTGADTTTTLYDPTGGHGALALTADPDKTHMNEINETRQESLRRQEYGTVSDHDATTYVPKKNYDRVHANPPFGSLSEPERVDGFKITKLEHLIALRALKAMKPAGRSAFILGANLRNPGHVSDADRIFMNYLLNNYHVAGNFEVSGDLYSNQGASYPVRVIVVAGKKQRSGKVENLAPQRVPRDTAWNQVYNRIQEVHDAIESQRQSVEPNEGQPAVHGDPEREGGPKDTVGDRRRSADDGKPSPRTGDKARRGRTGTRDTSGRSSGAPQSDAVHGGRELGDGDESKSSGGVDSGTDNGRDDRPDQPVQPHTLGDEGDGGDGKTGKNSGADESSQRPKSSNVAGRRRASVKGKKSKAAGFLRNVSEEDRRAAEAYKKKIQKRLGRMSSGVDPELLTDGIQLTSIYVKGGLLTEGRIK